MGVIESGSKTVVLSCLKNLAVDLYYKMSGADGVDRKRVKKSRVLSRLGFSQNWAGCK